MDNLLVTCTACNKSLPDSEFYRAVSKKSSRNPGRKSHCKSCVKKQRNDYYKTPEGYRKKIEKSWRDKGMSITLDEYNVLLDSQKGVCAICGSDRNKNGTALCVDHCHTTGVVRGLLCHNCNVSIGRFNDDVNLLMKAIHYLQGKKEEA